MEKVIYTSTRHKFWRKTKNKVKIITKNILAKVRYLEMINLLRIMATGTSKRLLRLSYLSQCTSLEAWCMHQWIAQHSCAELSWDSKRDSELVIKLLTLRWRNEQKLDIDKLTMICFLTNLKRNMTKSMIWFYMKEPKRRGRSEINSLYSTKVEISTWRTTEDNAPTRHLPYNPFCKLI